MQNWHGITQVTNFNLFSKFVGVKVGLIFERNVGLASPFSLGTLISLFDSVVGVQLESRDLENESIAELFSQKWSLSTSMSI